MHLRDGSDSIIGMHMDCNSFILLEFSEPVRYINYDGRVREILFVEIGFRIQICGILQKQLPTIGIETTCCSCAIGREYYGMLIQEFQIYLIPRSI